MMLTKEDEDMDRLLGDQIRKLRSVRNLTQEDIADRIGVSRQKYARIENGVNSITLNLLTKIADVLDVTVGDITGVLDEVPAVEYRGESDDSSFDKIFEMIDFFYANKSLYEKLHQRDAEQEA